MSSNEVASPIRRSANNKWPKRFALTMVIASLLYCVSGFVSLNTLTSTSTIFWLTAFNGAINLIVTGVIWLGLLVLTVAWWRRRFHEGFLLITVACLAIGTFVLATARDAYLGTATLNGQVYYLSWHEDSDSNWLTASLCGCNSSRVACQCHDFYRAYSPIISVVFSVTADDATNELTVKLNDKILYVYGPSPRCYEQPEIIDYCINK
jgi:hypothetical protein